ncbi:TRAP transporter large permease [Desulfothermus naphthae]
MDFTSIGIAGIIVLLVTMFFLRIPVGFAMGIVGFLGFWICINFNAALGMIGEETWKVLSSYGLTVIPLFILMGQICFYSGVNKRMYRWANVILGEIKGGLAMATIIACAGFSAICGSNTATAATMATVALPEMKKYGYDPAFSAGVVATGATLGVLIPPSVVLIIIGLQTGQSIRDLFLGSVIPGLLLTFGFLLGILIICQVIPSLVPGGSPTSLKDKIKALFGFWEVFLLFALVIGGLSFGIFTPSEAGAAGTFLALMISLFRKNLGFKELFNAIYDTLKISCMIYVIILGAVIFGRFLTITRIPYDTASYVTSLNLPSWIIMGLVFLIYLIGGAIMDALALLLITIPIFFPVAKSLGYDPIWFGVWITLITTMGAVTPPVGINVFIVSAMDKELNLAKVIKGVIIFLPIFIIIIFLLLAFPKLVTWLPHFIT